MEQQHESILVSRVLELLANLPRQKTLEQVAKESGLPYRWVSRLPVLRPSESTNIIRVEKLYIWLSGVDLSRAIK